MSLRLALEEKDNKDITEPSVGIELEVHAIPFIYKRDNKLFYVSDIVQILKAPGIKVEDDSVTDINFVSELKKIALKENVVLENLKKTSFVFEFVTDPVKNLTQLEHQFQEIARLETSLISYLLLKKRFFQKSFVCVKEWLDQLPENEITPGKRTDEMFILVDYSIENLQLTGEQKQNNDITQVSEEIQKKLKHQVQFNFVVALSKKMGSMFVEILDTNNKISKKKILLHNELKRYEQLNHADDLQKSLKKIAQHEKYIESHEIERRILLHAEYNAERACEHIQSQAKEKKVESALLKNPAQRDLAKLNGLFFILSMRILTETTYIPLAKNVCQKSKYPFFIKTQLSRLVHCISENDKVLLNEIEAWDEDQKNHLFALIAGSYQALTMRFTTANGNTYTVRDVIQSTIFCFRQDYLPLCDLFPNASIKSFEIPVEPKGIRSKEQSVERVLVEYRKSVDKTLSEALEEMKKLLHVAANFCKTTYLRKQELSQGIDGLAKYQGTFDAAQYAEVDDNISRAIDCILITLLPDFKNAIREILFVEDADTTLKQINYFFQIASNLEDTSEEHKNILRQLYVEAIFTIFSFPINAAGQHYINYIRKFYDLTVDVDEVVDYLKFLEIFSARFPDNFEIEFNEINGTIEYSTASSVLINAADDDDDDDKTMMYYACKHGLRCIVDALLEHYVVITEYNVIDALVSGILDKSLAKKFIDAGVDVDQCFYKLIKAQDEAYIPQLVEIFGVKALDTAIENSNKGYIVEELKKIKAMLSQATSPTLRLNHSVTFVSQEHKEPQVLPQENVSPPTLLKKERSS